MQKKQSNFRLILFFLKHIILTCCIALYLLPFIIPGAIWGIIDSFGGDVLTMVLVLGGHMFVDLPKFWWKSFHEYPGLTILFFMFCIGLGIFYGAWTAISEIKNKAKLEKQSGDFNEECNLYNVPK